MQEPAPVRCTWEPLTVQLPLAAIATARPDEAAAVTAKSGSPKVLFASAPKEIVWLAFAIGSVCVALGAAL